MKTKRLVLCLTAAWCVALGANAQYDYDGDESDGLGLYYDEEEPEDTTPPRKEYKNLIYARYSPSRYHFDGASPHLHFQEFTLGYARSLQVQEKIPFFVEAGIEMKYSYSPGDAAHENASYGMLTFRVPFNVVYKFYLSKRDIALAPFAGVNLRLGAMAKQKLDGKKTDLFDEDLPNTTGVEWERAQLGWQTGLKLCLSHTWIGVSYGRDFPDDSKLPQLHECSVHVGYSF